MTRTATPFSTPDLSALARALEKSLADHHATHGRLPGHVEMMNLLARGVSKRNLQALQAEAARNALQARPAPAADVSGVMPSDDPFHHAPAIVAAPAEAPAAPLELTEHARRALQLFDTAGRLVRWPLKLSVQRLAMWVLWTRFDARRVYTEAEVNRILQAWHLYGDHATLRRELIDHRLMTRKSDCSEYRKHPLRPDVEVQGLLQAMRASARQRTGRRDSPPRRLPPAASPAASRTGSGTSTGTDADAR